MIEVLIFRRCVFLSFFSVLLHIFCQGIVDFDLIHVQFFNFSQSQLLVAPNFILLCYIVLTTIQMEIGKLELGLNEVDWWRMWENSLLFYFWQTLTFLMSSENSLKNSMLDSWVFCFGPGTLASLPGGGEAVCLWTVLVALLLIYWNLDYSNFFFGHNILNTLPIDELT